MSKKERSAEISKTIYKKEIKKVPEVEKLKESFRKRCFAHRILILLLFVLLIYLCYYLYVIQWDKANKLFVTVMPGIVILFNMYTSYFAVLIKRREVKDIKEDRIGKFTKKQLLQIVDEVLSPVRKDGGEIPAFYIHNSESFNMFAIDVLLFNFVKPLNAIYISEDSLNNLSRNELKAVLAHEVGHFRYYMYPLSRSLYIFIITVALLPAAIAVALHADSYWYSFIIYIVIFKVLKFFLKLPFYASMKVCEYLSDYYAARQSGMLNIINGLLVTGKHIEMMVYIQRASVLRVMKSRNYSYQHLLIIIKKIEESLKNRIMTRRELDHLIEKTFNSPEVKKMREDLTGDDVKNRNRKLKNYINQLMGKHSIKLTNWRYFDFHIKDNRVDEVEYPFLIKTLIENPRNQLLRYKFDNIFENLTGSHPTMRERILFLHKNIHQFKKVK